MVVVGSLVLKKKAWGGVEYVKYTGGSSVTAPCLDMFFYHVQVDDMHHRVVGALVVVDFQLHHPVDAVYLPYFHLAWELKAVDTLSRGGSRGGHGGQMTPPLPGVNILYQLAVLG